MKRFFISQEFIAFLRLLFAVNIRGSSAHAPPNATQRISLFRNNLLRLEGISGAASYFQSKILRARGSWISLPRKIFRVRRKRCNLREFFTVGWSKIKANKDFHKTSSSPFTKSGARKSRTKEKSGECLILLAIPLIKAMINDKQRCKG